MTDNQNGSLAQLAEQVPLKDKVGSSILPRPKLHFYMKNQVAPNTAPPG